VCFYIVIQIILLIIGKSYAEVKIAILDSGCNIECQNGVSFVDDNITDLNGHGTAIAKIIKEYNPDAKLYIAKVLNGNGSNFNITPIVNGILWAISCRVDIINISLQIRSDEDAIYDAIKQAYQSGIIIVAAAGNKNDFIDNLVAELHKLSQVNNISTNVKYPANYEEVIAIGAIRKFLGSDRLENYSPVGEKIEFVCNGSYGSQKGTSFASARATAIISKIKTDYPKYSGTQLREILRFYARDLGDKGNDPKFGYGKLEYRFLHIGELSPPLKRTPLSRQWGTVQYAFDKAS
jgi:subtilisin family serine protease